jgi:hypothetical protein
MGSKPEVVDVEEMRPWHCANSTGRCHCDQFDQYRRWQQGCWCDCNVCAGIED